MCVHCFQSVSVNLQSERSRGHTKPSAGGNRKQLLRPMAVTMSPTMENVKQRRSRTFE